MKLSGQTRDLPKFRSTVDFPRAIFHRQFIVNFARVTGEITTTGLSEFSRSPPGLSWIFVVHAFNVRQNGCGRSCVKFPFGLGVVARRWGEKEATIATEAIVDSVVEKKKFLRAFCDACDSNLWHFREAKPPPVTKKNIQNEKPAGRAATASSFEIYYRTLYPFSRKSRLLTLAPSNIKRESLHSVCTYTRAS